MSIESIKMQTIANLKELQTFLLKKSQNEKYTFPARERFVTYIQKLLVAIETIEDIEEE